MTLTRRSMMQAVAAMLFAPTITLRETDNREKLLAAFCYDDNYGHRRFDINDPFRVGSLAYATDAKQICRAELPAIRDNEAERRIPPVESLWKSLWHPQKWTPFVLPEYSRLTHKASYPLCPECGNRRISCGEAYPTREWLESQEASDYDYDVDDNSIRDQSCPACRGKDYREASIVMIAGEPFEYFPMRRIAALPNVRVTISRAIHEEKSIQPSRVLLFQADGFEGMAMPIASHVVSKTR